MVNISFPKQQFNTCIQYLVFCSGRWKKRIGRQHMTLTLCQNAACSNEFFFLAGRLYSGGKRFD